MGNSSTRTLGGVGTPIATTDATNKTYVDTNVNATVPLNRGGTGQTTKAPAFDALSPMTTGGDLIYGGASGTGTRLANGTSGYVLKSAGGTAAPSWVDALTLVGGANVPTVQRFLTGSGTYTTPAGVVYITVDVQGGGAGGAGGGSGSPGAGTAGNATNFGSVSCNGGSTTAAQSIGGAGGTVSATTGATSVLISVSGGGGGGGGAQLTTFTVPSGQGGDSFYGGGGSGTFGGNAGGAGAANSGAGGAGGGGNNGTAVNSGGGGGGGAFARVLYSGAQLLSSYTYAVGGTAAAGAAGTNGAAGGAGGSGYIEVTEYYANGAVGTATTITTTLPISTGGTGQTTKAAAYDALSPNTTEGDIEYRNATTNVRLPVGTNGQYLGTTGSGTSAQTVAWNSFIPPSVQKFTSGPGNCNWAVAFIVSSASATVGATYTHNGVTYTVLNTVASSTRIYLTGNGTPQSTGTLTKASGTGDATITFSAYRVPLFQEVEMIGGGGGGSGSTTTVANNAGAGGNGGTTTYGSQLSATGGGGGGVGGAPFGTAGGTASLGTGPVGSAITGSIGSSSSVGTSGGAYPTGGNGGSSPFGGAGGGAPVGAGGNAAVANSGSGGGGGGSLVSLNAYTGTGGGSGGYLKAFIFPVASTTAYDIGGGGGGGIAGTSGFTGGAGAFGVIIVISHYQ